MRKKVYCHRIITAIKQPNKIRNYLKWKAKFIASIDLIEILLSIQSMYKLLKIVYKPKSVLMIEPNAFHGEILPGFCYYFSELGYSITLIVRRENYNSGVFSRFSRKEMPKVFCMSNFIMKCIIKKIRPCFDVVFVTSATLAQKSGYYGFFNNYLGYNPSGREGVFYIEHSYKRLVDYIVANNVGITKILQLRYNKFQKENISMINPNYFGHINIKGRGRENIFITVGEITNRNRNFFMLSEAVNRLKQKGYRDFKIYVIGRSVLKKQFTGAPSEIIVLGRLCFKELYMRMEEADFFLPLLDPAIDGHRRYLKWETTGSRQLILGFYKIPLIQNDFAIANEFSAANSIVYECDGLCNAMEKAINLSKEEFTILQENLRKLTQSIRDDSIKNLKSVLEGL